MLGILGGMGPLATADLLTKIILNTHARNDQEHIPIIVWNVPQVPDRTLALLGLGPSPLPAMQAGIVALIAGGASTIAIACNTAHAWYDELQNHSSARIIHIADATATAMAGMVRAGSKVGLLATKGTIGADIYDEPLKRHGYEVVAPSDSEQEELVSAAIDLVKGGRVMQARQLLDRGVANLRAQGAEAIIMGCTEIPVAFAGDGQPFPVHFIDATDALAKACVAEYFNNATGTQAPWIKPVV